MIDWLNFLIENINECKILYISTTISIITMFNDISLNIVIKKDEIKELKENVENIILIKNDIKLIGNREINEIIYKNYENKAKIPFSFKEFSEKQNNGGNNINYIKLQLQETIKNKIWIRNNFRYYNIEHIKNLNNLYCNSLKLIHGDYIFNNLLFKYNKTSLINLGKIDIIKIINNNWLTYYDEKIIKMNFKWYNKTDFKAWVI